MSTVLAPFRLVVAIQKSVIRLYRSIYASGLYRAIRVSLKGLVDFNLSVTLKF